MKIEEFFKKLFAENPALQERVLLDFNSLDDFKEWLKRSLSEEQGET